MHSNIFPPQQEVSHRDDMRELAPSYDNYACKQVAGSVNSGARCVK
jgi:hypothetical protein